MYYAANAISPINPNIDRIVIFTVLSSSLVFSGLKQQIRRMNVELTCGILALLYIQMSLDVTGGSNYLHIQDQGITVYSHPHPYQPMSDHIGREGRDQSDQIGRA